MSTNYKDAAAALNDWVSISEASRLRGVTRQAISKLAKLGRLESVRVAGRTLVNKKEVLEFEPKPAGRPKSRKKGLARL